MSLLHGMDCLKSVYLTMIIIYTIIQTTRSCRPTLHPATFSLTHNRETFHRHTCIWRLFFSFSQTTLYIGQTSHMKIGDITLNFPREPETFYSISTVKTIKISNVFSFENRQKCFFLPGDRPPMLGTVPGNRGCQVTLLYVSIHALLSRHLCPDTNLYWVSFT